MTTSNEKYTVYGGKGRNRFKWHRRSFIDGGADNDTININSAAVTVASIQLMVEQVMIS